MRAPYHASVLIRLSSGLVTVKVKAWLASGETPLAAVIVSGQVSLWFDRDRRERRHPIAGGAHVEPCHGWHRSRRAFARASLSVLVPDHVFFAQIRVSASRAGAVRAVETLPHFPPFPKAFYACPDLPEAGAGAVAKLVGMFKPATDADRGLIVAMIMTPFWGGEPGSRPMFLVSAAPDDPDRGRGVGKSKLTELIAAELAGGCIETTPSDEIGKIKTRLLSPDAATKRIVRLDNVKNNRLAWSDLEGIVTAGTISGHAMYRGEGSRPNTITWFVTANTPGTGKDAAQRVIPVVLARPEFRPAWEQEVRTFIRNNKLEILADIRDTLAGPGVSVNATRCGPWEAQVLSKVGDAKLVADCQALVRQRQGDMDADDEEQAIVADRFMAELRNLNLDPETWCVKIPVAVAAEWLNAALNERLQTNKASSRLKGLGIPNLSKDRNASNRYWLWSGDRVEPGTQVREVEKTPPGSYGPLYRIRPYQSRGSAPTSRRQVLSRQILPSCNSRRYCRR